MGWCIKGRTCGDGLASWVGDAVPNACGTDRWYSGFDTYISLFLNLSRNGANDEQGGCLNHIGCRSLFSSCRRDPLAGTSLGPGPHRLGHCCASCRGKLCYASPWALCQSPTGLSGPSVPMVSSPRRQHTHLHCSVSHLACMRYYGLASRSW